MKKTSLGAVLLMALFAPVLLIGCAASEAEDRSLNDIATSPLFERVETIHIKETDSLHIADFKKAVVTLDPFRIYIPDFRLHRIAVLDETGQLTHFIGKRGTGPGEFRFAMNVIEHEGVIYGVDRQDLVLAFDPDGTFLHQLTPEKRLDVASRGQSTLMRDGRFYTSVSKREIDSAHFFAIMDEDLNLIGTFGDRPDLWHIDQPILGDAFFDFFPDGRVAVSAAMGPDVWIYDLSTEPATLVTSFRYDAPTYRPVSEPIASDIYAFDDALETFYTSHEMTQGIWTVGDSVVVMPYSRYDREFYEEDYSKEFIHDYAALMDVSGAVLETVSLPGWILTKDAQDRFYVLRSYQPDARIIDIYEYRGPAS